MILSSLSVESGLDLQKKLQSKYNDCHPQSQRLLGVVNADSQKLQIKKMSKMDIPVNSIVEAFGLAEAIVRGQKGEQMSDLISRQAAIQVVRNYMIECQITDGYYHSDYIERKLYDLPSAESEIIRCYEIGMKALLETDVPDTNVGKWIKKHGTINCSNCKQCGWSESFEFTVSRFKYCPNCGAKMIGDEKDE